MESKEILEIVDNVNGHLDKEELVHSLKISSSIRTILSQYLKDRGYIEIPPVIISIITDPLNHPVFDPKLEYYGYQYSLTKSMIFHKQILAKHFEKFFTFSPNIRLETEEKAKTGRHLYEFTQLDLEQRNASRDDMMRLAEGMLVHLFKKIKETNGDDLRALSRDLRIPSVPFERITYEKAVHEYGKDFENILSKTKKDPFWITDIPLKEREFYDRENENDPGKLIDMDLIYPEGFGEAISGGEREFEYSKIIERIHKKGQTEEQFRWYLEFAKDGFLPSAGFGIGIERLTRYVCGFERIEDTHPFPKVPGKIAL